jgi:hypothetical protein
MAQMVEYRRYAQAEQAANKHRVEALRLKEEVARERQRTNLIAGTYETIAQHEKQLQEQARLRQLQEDMLTQKLCWQADMALLRSQFAESQKKRPLIYR